MYGTKRIQWNVSSPQKNQTTGVIWQPYSEPETNSKCLIQVITLYYKLSNFKYMSYYFSTVYCILENELNISQDASYNLT